MTALQITSLSKTFTRGRNRLRALDSVSLTVASGEMVALLGASGSGKSTLMRHIAGLASADRSTEKAEIRALGCVVQSGGSLARDVRRSRSCIGFIFQQFNLVGRLTVLTNVLVGTLGRVSYWRGALGRFTKSEKQLAMQALQRVGMAEFAAQRADTLSGGQQQRVAIARTLAQRAELILADEPVASLDPESSRIVLETLAEINRRDGKTVVVSLHQVEYALRYCPRTVALKDGKVRYDGPSSALTQEFLHDIYGAEQSVELLTETSPAPNFVPVHATAVAGGTTRTFSASA